MLDARTLNIPYRIGLHVHVSGPNSQIVIYCEKSTTENDSMYLFESLTLDHKCGDLTA